MSKKLYCEHCGAPIYPETEVYFESDYDVVYCEECADEFLMHSDDVQTYVHVDQYKEFYLDDELSDVGFFTKYEPEGDI